MPATDPAFRHAAAQAADTAWHEAEHPRATPRKIYEGFRRDDGRLCVHVLSSPSDGAGYVACPLRHVERHSPDGVECGYNGAGPADLALSILCDLTGDEGIATEHYQALKSDVIAKLPRDAAWKLADVKLWAWLALHDAVEECFDTEDSQERCP